MSNRAIKQAIHSALDLFNDGLTVDELVEYVESTGLVQQNRDTLKQRVIDAIMNGLYKEELFKLNGMIYKKEAVHQACNHGTLFLTHHLDGIITTVGYELLRTSSSSSCASM